MRLDTKVATKPETRLHMVKLFTRSTLRTLGQFDDAENNALVENIARTILMALPVWTAKDSPLRDSGRDDHENAYT